MTWATDEAFHIHSVSWCETDRAFNLASYSKHATSVRLLLFDDLDPAVPRVEVSLEPLTNKSGRVSTAAKGECDLYVMVNACEQPLAFVLQDTTHPWHVAIDTARSPPDDIELDQPPLLGRPSYLVRDHSVVVLVGD